MTIKHTFLTTISIAIIALTIWVQPVNASSKCHSINGKADTICTPGVTNPKVTQINIHSTICISGYTTKIRPSVSYTEKLKKQQIKDYGYADTKLGDYEEDHLIPLELGGSPTDPKNLWPEPHKVSGNKGSFDKDKVENLLHSSVCKGIMTLEAAQNQIKTNWETITTVQKKNTPLKTPTVLPPVNATTNSTVNTQSSTDNQNGATALCNDSTYSYAAHHQGACSKHGGVKEFYK